MNLGAAETVKVDWSVPLYSALSGGEGRAVNL